MFGQRILRADHQHQLVAKNRLNFQARRLNRQRENSHIDRTVLKLLDDLVTEISINADLYRRILAAVFAKDFGQNIKASGFVRPNTQRTSGSSAVVRDRHQRLIAQVAKTFGIFEKNLAGGSQFHALAGAIKKAVAVFLFELANLRAYRGLRAKDFFTRARKAALLGNFKKRDELIEIHWESNQIIADARRRRIATRCCLGVVMRNFA